MKEFNKIIGYEDQKRTVMLLADFLRNPDPYTELGVKAPKGLLLCGVSGTGKSLMADCLIKASGRECISYEPGTSMKEYTSFEGSILYIADADAVNLEELNALAEALYDAGVFVLAESEDVEGPPVETCDYIVVLEYPGDEASWEIAKKYVSGRKIADDVNLDDVAKLCKYISCKQLSEYMDRAAMEAIFDGHDSIHMEHIVRSYLGPYTGDAEEGELEEIAWHEAGHVIAAEALRPGSVGAAAVTHINEFLSGHTRCCVAVKERAEHIRVSLAGKAAVEIGCSAFGTGCERDYIHAMSSLAEDICKGGRYGTSFLKFGKSVDMRTEAVITAELERYMQEARNILFSNMDLLTAVKDILVSKRYLLRSDLDMCIEKFGLCA